MKRENFERAQELYDFIDDEKRRMKDIEEILKLSERVERLEICHRYLKISMDYIPSTIIYIDAEVALNALQAQWERAKEHIRLAEEEMESL